MTFQKKCDIIESENNKTLRRHSNDSLHERLVFRKKRKKNIPIYLFLIMVQKLLTKQKKLTSFALNMKPLMVNVVDSQISGVRNLVLSVKKNDEEIDFYEITNVIKSYK